MEKNNKLKKILTTASVFAMIAGASNSAMAGDNRIVEATPANLNYGAGLNGAVAFEDDDNLDVNFEGAEITVGGNKTIGQLRVSKADSKFLIGNDTLKITAFDKAGGQKTVLGNNNTNGTLEISATNADNVVSEINVGQLDFTTANGADFGGNIDVATFNIKGANDTVFNGTVKADAVVIGEANKMTFAKALEAGMLRFGAAGTAVLSGGLTGDVNFADDENATVQLADGKTIDGNVDAGDAGKGKLEFLGGGTVTGTIGNANRIALIDAKGAGTVTLTGATKATKLQVSNAGANVEFANKFTGGTEFVKAGTVKFKGDVTGGVNFKGQQGTVEIAGAKTLTGAVSTTKANTGILRFTGAGGGVVVGAIGAADALELIEVATNTAGPVRIGGANAVKAATLKINSANAPVVAKIEVQFTGGVEFSNGENDGGTLNLADAAAGGSKITGNITTGNNKKGNILVNTNGATITGTIGEAGKALKDVKVDNQTLTLSKDKNAYSETFTFTGNAGQITVGENGELHATADGVGFKAENDNDGKIVFNKGGTITGTIGTKGKTIGLVQAGNGNAGVVTVGAGDHHVAEFKAGQAGSGFIFEDDANVTGAIDSANAGNTLVFEGTSTVTGNIGDTAEFASITLNKDAVLTLKPSDAQTLNGAVKVANAGEGKVVIDKNAADKSVTFKSAIGGEGKALGSLVLENNFVNTATLEKDSFIQEVDLIRGATLALGENGQDTTFKLNRITTATANKGTLSVLGGAAKGITLNALSKDNGANIGTAEAPLKALTFDGLGATLTLGKNVKLYAKDAGAAGVLTLENGSALYIQDNTAANGLNTITVAKDATAMIGDKELGGKVNVANGVELGGNKSTLELATESITANGINAKNAGEGTLRFVGEKNSTVNAQVGGNKTFGSIEFLGSGDVTFNKAVQTKNGGQVKFSDLKKDITVKFAAAANAIDDNFGKSVFTNNSGYTPTFDLGENNMTFTDTGKIESGQINFKTAANKTITIGSTGFKNANITGGKLAMNKDSAVINSAGTSTAPLASIEFTENGTITNGAHSKGDIAVTAGKVATLGGQITASTGPIVLNGDAKVSFKDGARVDVVISGNDGTAEFNDTTSLLKKVDGIAKVDFKKDSKTSLYADIGANTIDVAGAHVNLENDVQFTGAVNFKEGSTISLDKRHLKLLGQRGSKNVTLGGKNTINATITSIEDSGVAQGGHITMSSGNLKYEDGTELTINVEDNSARPVGESIKHKLLIVQNAANLAENSKLTGKGITVNTNKPNSRLVMNQWNAEVSERGDITLTQTDNAKDVLTNLAKGAGAGDSNAVENMAAISNAKAGSDAYNLVDLLARVGDDSNPDKKEDVKKIVTGLENKDVRAHVITEQVTNSSGKVTRRLYQIQKAVAGGDCNYKYGSWVNPFYSVSEQKARGGFTGYKEESFGASIGFDSELSSDMLLGAAFNISKNKVTYKDIKKGDETAINSFALSLYGMKQISDYWSLSSVATVASSNIKSEKKTISGVGTSDLVKGENNALSFNGEFTATYSQDIGGAIMSPMGGLRYTRVNATGYKETGSSSQNLSVAQRATDKLEVIAGMKLSVPGLDINGLPVTPDVHASVDYDALANPNKQTVRMDGVKELASAKYKPARAVYKVGLGANAEYDIWEYAIGYDIQISDKHLGYQGNFRLRVNF